MLEVEVLGIWMGIGGESVDMGVVLMERPELAFEVEKSGLKLANRSALCGGGDFGSDALNLRRPVSQQPLHESQIAPGRERLASLPQSRFQTANAFVELPQPDSFVGLGRTKRVELERIQFRRENQPVGVQAPGNRLLQFLRRAENFCPTVVLGLKAFS